MSERPLLSEDNFIPKDGQSHEEFLGQFEWWHEMLQLQKKFEPQRLERRKIEKRKIEKRKIEAGRQNKPFVPDPHPPLPVNFILTLIRKTVAQPEVMSAHASVPPDGDIPPIRSKIIRKFSMYLCCKYGDERHISPMTSAVMTIAVRYLANKQKYTGVDDPKLRAELLTYNDICEDDGVDYE